MFAGLLIIESECSTAFVVAAGVQKIGLDLVENVDKIKYVDFILFFQHVLRRFVPIQVVDSTLSQPHCRPPYLLLRLPLIIAVVILMIRVDFLIANHI